LIAAKSSSSVITTSGRNGAQDVAAIHGRRPALTNPGADQSLHIPVVRQIAMIQKIDPASNPRTLRRAGEGDVGPAGP
jgi:hypothetical protein